MNTNPAGRPVIETSTGEFVDMERFTASDFNLNDVSNALATITRYTGHTTIDNGDNPFFYSVAEHACYVAGRLLELDAPYEVALAGLHHDDQEAYVGDMNSPLKSLIPHYKAIERQFAIAVRIGLGLEDLPWDDPRIKQADDWALGFESYYLLPSKGFNWGDRRVEYHPEPYHDNVYPEALGWSPRAAKAAYRDLHSFLGGKDNA